AELGGPEPDRPIRVVGVAGPSKSLYGLGHLTALDELRLGPERVEPDPEPGQRRQDGLEHASATFLRQGLPALDRVLMEQPIPDVLLDLLGKLAHVLTLVSAFGDLGVDPEELQIPRLQG